MKAPPDNPNLAMACHWCGDRRSMIVDSRCYPDYVRRRRVCLGCTRRCTTYEYAEDAAVNVVKRDGRRERFDRAKLRISILRALGKRPDWKIADAITEEMEAHVLDSGVTETSTVAIREEVRQALYRRSFLAPMIRYDSFRCPDVQTFRAYIAGLAQIRNDPKARAR